MKRFLSLFLVVLFVFSFAVECMAYNSDRIATEYFEEYCEEFSGQEVLSGQMPSYFYRHSDSVTDYSSYSLLTDIEKTFYDKVVSLDVGVLSFTFNYSPALTKAEYESINFTKIMNAICLDHPEIFYYNGYGISRSYYTSTGAVTKIVYSIAVKKHGQTNTAIYSTSNIPGYYTAMMNAINRVQLNTTTRYDFVKSLHNYLCNSVTYVNDYASCHDAYGTLVNGEAVCQGYAETFKLFCDRYNIPCVCITGTANGGAHMWNAVQMDDGLWYLLDATWDDQDSYGIFTDFFLVGLLTKDKYFGGYTFNSSHISDGSPYLPPLDYSPTGPFSESGKYSLFGATYNSRSIIADKKIVLSCFDVGNNKIYYNGMYVNTASFYTSANVVIPSGANAVNENWNLVLIGDCNGDGKANYTDYSQAVNVALDDPIVDDDYDMACDVIEDGVVDALDIAVLERAYSGSNDKIILEE